MRWGRLAIAIVVPAALGLVSYLSMTGGAVARGNQPEIGVGLPIGGGLATAISARRAAARGEGLARVAALSVRAVQASPLNASAFLATAQVVPQPDLAEALILHAHSLTRRDRPMLEAIAAQAVRRGDAAGTAAALDELFTSMGGVDQRAAVVADLLAVPAGRDAVATIFERPRTWRNPFFMQVDPSPTQTASLRLLIDDMRRHGKPIPDAALAPLIQRLSFGSDDRKVKGWQIWSARKGGSAFAWPQGEPVAGLVYDWSVPDDLADQVTFGDGMLRYDLGGAAGAIVAKMTAGLPAGRYRASIVRADPRVQMRVTCNAVTTGLGNGDVVDITSECPVQSLAIWAPAGAGAVGEVLLNPVR